MNLEADNIKIFTVPSCGRCQAVKAHLEALGLEYTEICVADNFAGLREMIRRSGSREVPVTVIDDHVVVGCDTVALNKALEPGS